ncbi:OadG family transporter subunit [Agathobaculum sp.]|uniref:OadG family transporter subunit n=1 Tax=Agathobaculum sp. TaxID=2048138 RepID=UPI0025DB6BC1|nr:OadG family transporter subunit [Agathobaculum sp.]MBS6641310.1 OadG family protein [Clostridiaceae bacterium]
MVQDPLSILDALMVALSGFIIVFIMLAVLWGVIVVISRAVTGVENRTDAAAGTEPMPAPVPAPTAPAAPAAPVAVQYSSAPQAQPQVVLEGISDTEAACVMAIVSHETGIPLDQLVFKSIKAV